MPSIPARLLWAAGALVLIIVVGVSGYMLIEGWSFFESLYMTIITITTVGYGEVHPLSTAGRIFSILLIVGGVGGALYTLSGIMEFVIEEQFGTTLRRRRMRGRIEKLRDHFILCGYGRVGRQIALEFRREGTPFVVIESHPERQERAAQEGCLHILGDATHDEVLKAAGIEHARGLVAAVGSDVASTFITLSARGLRPDLFILARANEEDAEAKLRRAGADRVISPHSISGRRMAMLALRPLVVEFVDTVLHGDKMELLLEDIELTMASPLLDKTLAEVEERLGGAYVMALKKRDGRLLPSPPGETRLEAGDQLVVMGTPAQLEALEGR